MTQETAREKAKRIFEDHRGVLRLSEAKKLGVHPQTLARMLRDGMLERPARGLYLLRTAARPIVDSDLVQVAKLVPKAVFCLLTALSIHDLTTQIPRLLYVALPRGSWKPSVTYPPLDITWLSQGAYRAGIEEHRIAGFAVPVYSREKTLADCFKFRAKVGEDVAVEALREYLRRRDRDIDRLLHYATIDRVRNVMEPYIKALA